MTRAPRRRNKHGRHPTRILAITEAEPTPLVAKTTRATAYRFSASACDVIEVPLDGGVDLREPGTLLWIDLQGTADTALIQNLGRVYGLHPLAVEDALHLQQRAKVESYPNHIFLVARMVHYDGRVSLEQLAMFVGHDFVITAQESHSDGDSFDLLRAQLRTHIRRPMPSTADLLAHALLDAVVDEYFPVLEAFGEALYSLEDEVINAKDQSVLGRIQGARRDVVTLRRALWPLRDALFMLGREGFTLGAEARLYLRDTTDHLLRIIDIAEGYRETVASLMELHMSSMSQRMNETMRVLAVISTIFIPLTFIVGIYGMNFDTDQPLNMPELGSPYGYPIIMSLMGLIAVGMMFFFWRRGWFGGRSGPPPDNEPRP
mgnify:CR=1 FL=1